MSSEATPRPSVLMVGGSPEPSSPALVSRLAATSDVVVAVDRGLDTLIAADVDPDLFCGDCDTASRTATLHLDCLVAAGTCELERYDPYKDFTDLALALRATHERWSGARITFTCFSGGRPDHFLAVVGTLARAPFSVALEEDGFSGRILRAGERWDIADASGDGFSFVPLLPDTVVSEQGMEWELDHRHCDALSDLGVSNIIRESSARVTCHEGCIVAYLFRNERALGTTLAN